MGHDKIKAAIETEVSKRKRRNTMERRILLVLLALILCFACISCTIEPSEGNEKEDDAPVVTEGRGYDREVAFTYMLRDGTQTYQRGDFIHITGYVTNVSGQTIKYMGVGSVYIEASLVCEADGEYYSIHHEEIPMPDAEPREEEFVPYDTDLQSFTFRVPHNAPPGNYSLSISAEGYSYVFENVLTVVE